MTPAERGLARAVALLGDIGIEVRGAVVVEDDETTRAHRRVMAMRAVTFAVGAALTLAWGVGWLVIVLAVVAHQLLFNVRRLLAATDDGLALADIGARRARIVQRWARGANATLTLRTDNPQVTISIDPDLNNTGVGPHWTGRVNGIDLDAAESAIRSTGGEPLRRTATD